MGMPDIHEPSEMRPRRMSLAGFAGDDDMICNQYLYARRGRVYYF